MRPLSLAAGADVNAHGAEERTALMAASESGRMACVLALIDHGADVNARDGDGDAAIWFACVNNELEVAQLLSSHGAERPFVEADTLGEIEDGDRLRAWIELSQHWTTPLHHIEQLDEARTRSLLRGGADLHARAPADGAPTPLERARALRAAGAADGSPAHLIERAAELWSPPGVDSAGLPTPGTHELFPDAARARAVEMWWLRLLISRQEGFGAMNDVWRDYMGRAVVRSLA